MTSKVLRLSTLQRARGMPGKGRGGQLLFRQPTALIPRSRVRAWPLLVLVVTVLSLLWLRLAQLTLVEGNYQRQRAEVNRVLGIRTVGQRGVFLDRQGEPLVRNLPVYKKQVAGTSLHQGLFEPVAREAAWQLAYETGERVFYDIDREYLCGRACAPLLGYLAEVTGAQLEQAGMEYVLGDTIGQSGLEKMLEERLRGQTGSQLVEVNAQGQEERVLGEISEQPGTDVTLTIDADLQRVLFEALSGKKGAAVAQVPETGEVLALVSSPAYDPNDVKASLQEADEPFFNRAVAGAYPPGSVFKVVTAIAGLEEGKVSGETSFQDTGEIRIDRFRYGNWLYDQYGRTEGQVTMVKGLQRSNDIYFYKVGEAVGATTLGEWARLFGYGATNGLEALGEVGGVVPSPEWKEKTKGERWFLGNTYHMAIGQGDVLVTPLQVNRMMGVIAAKGKLCPVTLLKDEVGARGCQELSLKTENVELVTEGLIMACQPGGTGVAFFDHQPQVACKTGTAQQGGELAEPHAWFTVFAPAQEPEIVLTVLVDHGGQGSEVAAPIAKIGIDHWLQQGK